MVKFTGKVAFAKGSWTSGTLTNSLSAFKVETSEGGIIEWDEIIGDSKSYVTIDILDSNNVILAEGLTNGTDLNATGTVGTNDIKVRVNIFARTKTPIVKNLIINFKNGVDSMGLTKNYLITVLKMMSGEASATPITHFVAGEGGTAFSEDDVALEDPVIITGTAIRKTVESALVDTDARELIVEGLLDTAEGNEGGTATLNEAVIFTALTGGDMGVRVVFSDQTKNSSIKYFFSFTIRGKRVTATAV